jgi:hypothetical protein
VSRDAESGERTRKVDQGVEPTGKFRVYFGAVAGVGKTWAMLDEGWRRYKRGSDVVIGFVETHGREHTAQQIRDLPVVPRKVVDYRGTTFEEMDLEEVLARKPEVALIDELAHTNVPGSGPHPKRWQDVLEILDAGIAVVSTVNVQHLESVADAVQRITGVAVRERVPDWVVRRADQLELIDSSPEQLRRRMLHGNVYPPEKIPSALTRTSWPCVSSRSVSSRTRQRKSSWGSSSPDIPTSSGTPPSASWWSSPQHLGSTRFCAVPPGSRYARTQVCMPSTRPATTLDRCPNRRSKPSST